MARRAEPAVADLVLRWAPIQDTEQEGFFDDDTQDGNLLFQGGWGAGKTITLTAKMLKLSAINAPLPGLWTVPRYAHIHETIIPTLESTDPETGDPWFLSPSQFHYHEQRHLFTWAGGGPIQFVSAEEPKGIAGPNMAFAGTDEPGSIKHEAWRNTCARVRHPGAKLRQRVAAGTPEGITYLLDYFGPERTDKYRLYQMATVQNTELTKYNPEFIEQLKNHMTEAEIQAYLGGKAVNITGALAHASFDPEVHWLHGLRLDPTLPLRVAFDFNVAPMACVIGQQVAGPFGVEAHAIDCVTIYDSTVMATCAEIVARYPTWPAGVIVYGDASGRARSASSTKTNYQLIKDLLAPMVSSSDLLEFRVPRANPAVTERLEAVNVLLKNARGHIRLFVNKTDPPRACSTRPLITSLQQTKKKTGTDDIEKKAGETVTHHGEALGYWIAREFPVLKPSLSAGSVRVEHLI